MRVSPAGLPMTPNNPEPKSIEDVRRWRKESYEARQRMSLEEQLRHDRELSERLGLGHLPTQTNPGAGAIPPNQSVKKAG